MRGEFKLCEGMRMFNACSAIEQRVSPLEKKHSFGRNVM